MKTIYNMKALCVVALLGATTALSAQEDTTKKQDLERQMTLEREYDPTVQDASKVNTLPVIKEPEVKKMSIDYANFTLAADPEKEISLLPSGNVMTDIKYNKRRGYLNFGGGTHLNLNGDVGYHILSTDKDHLGIWFSHRSTNGNVTYLQRDEDVKAKVNDNLGGINFKHQFNNAALKMGLKYGYSAYNYYGYPVVDNPFSSATQEELVSDTETNQVAQTIQANLGVESSEDASFGYDVNFGFTNFGYKYWNNTNADDGIKENTAALNFNFFAPFNSNHKIGVAGDVRYFNYSVPEVDGGINPITWENHFNGVLNPYYKIEGDSWNIKLGAKAMLSAGGDDGTKFSASPDVAADVEVANKTVLYLKAGGDLKHNSMYDINQINRYTAPYAATLPSFNWFDGQFGVKSGVAPGFWFEIFAGYKMTKDDYLFVPTLSNRAGEFGNFSAPLTYFYNQAINNGGKEMIEGIDTKQLFFGADLKYSYQQLFDINVKGVYNKWDATAKTVVAERDITAYGKPEMEITAGVTIRPMKNLSASLDYYLATGRQALLPDLAGTEIEMNNINELSLTGTYNLNETFGIYLKLNNVLFQEYELYYGYPMQKFSALVGFNLNF